MVLVIECRALPMLGKHSTIEIQPQIWLPLPELWHYENRLTNF